jgi:hypothetical protein
MIPLLHRSLRLIGKRKVDYYGIDVILQMGARLSGLLLLVNSTNIWISGLSLL